MGIITIKTIKMQTYAVPSRKEYHFFFLLLNLIYLKIKLVTMKIKIRTFLDILPFNNEQ